MAKSYADAEAVPECEKIKNIIGLMKKEALDIYNEDIDVCRKIGEHALTLVNKGRRTHHTLQCRKACYSKIRDGNIRYVSWRGKGI